MTSLCDTSYIFVFDPKSTRHQTMNAHGSTEDVYFSIIMVFIKKYYNGKFLLNKKTFFAEERLDSSMIAHAVLLFTILDDANIFSIYRCIIENDEKPTSVIKKKVLELLVLH